MITDIFNILLSLSALSFGFDLGQMSLSPGNERRNVAEPLTDSCALTLPSPSTSTSCGIRAFRAVPIGALRLTGSTWTRAL